MGTKQLVIYDTDSGEIRRVITDDDDNLVGEIHCGSGESFRIIEKKMTFTSDWKLVPDIVWVQAQIPVDR